MPLTLIQTVLGVAFALIWAFIGAMILRDGQFAVRREREESSGWQGSTAGSPRRAGGSGHRAGSLVGSSPATRCRRGTSAA
jgi:hypothetical protein